MRSTPGIHFQATESMHDHIVLHEHHQFSVLAGDLESPLQQEEEEEALWNVNLSEATINGQEIALAEEEALQLPPHSASAVYATIRPKDEVETLIRTGNCASPVTKGDEVDVVTISNDTKVDDIAIGLSDKFRNLHDENEVLEPGEKVTSNAASIEASKAQSLAEQMSIELLGHADDLLLHEVEGCNILMTVDDGAVNKSTAISGLELGGVERASHEQHAADGIMTKVKDNPHAKSAVEGSEEPMAVQDSVSVVYQMVSVEPGKENGALPAGEAAAAVDAQVKTVDAMDGVEMHKEKLIAKEVNKEVMRSVENDHDNKEVVIVLKQSGSVHASGEEAFTGGAQLGMSDTGDDGVDSHGPIEPVLVLPENAKTAACIVKDGTVEEDGRPSMDGIALQSTSRSQVTATMEIDQDSKEAAALSTEAVNEQPDLELQLERPDDAMVLNLTGHPVGSGQPVSSVVDTESGKLSTLDEVLIATTCAGLTEGMTGALQVHVSRGSDDNLSEGLDLWGIKLRKRKRPLTSKITPGQLDAAPTTLGPLVDLPVTSVPTTSLTNVLTMYGNLETVREDLSGFQSASQVMQDELHVDADKHLEQAQNSAQEAMATATFALAQSQIVWARTHSHKPSDLGTAREAQIASLAATVAAAAAVAKAAIEAARAIGQASNEACLQSDVRNGGPAMQGSLGSGVVPSHLPFKTTQASDEHPQQVASGSQFGQSTKRAVTEIHQNVEMLEPMVRAAGLAAQAATQAGAMMATGNPLMQATSMANYWMRKVAELKGEANQKGKSQAHKNTKLTKSRGVEEIFLRTGELKKQAGHTGSLQITTPKKMKDKQLLHTRSPLTTTPPKKVKDKEALHRPMTIPRKKMDKKASLKRVVAMKGKELVQGKAEDAGKSSSKHSPSNQKMTAISEMAPRYAASQLAGFATQRLDVKELVGWSNINDNPEVISEGSVVEVMSGEEGLRGGWFSAKVFRFTEQEALVVYDELLTEDGRSNLKEWFPRKDSFVGSGVLRCMRPMHPFVFIKDKGSRIRRRIAMGSQAWSVGDHVDAFLQDGWWEGIVMDVNDMDENKITVYFPGEEDTAVVKTWNVRPSLTWKDGVWGPWTDTWNTEGGRQPAKLQKLESPIVRGKKMAKKRKLMELREDAPETSAPLRHVPRLSEGKTSRVVSHAHQKFAEVGSTALSTPKHRASYDVPKSTKKHSTPEIRTPTTRKQSAPESDSHKKPRRAL